MSAARIKIKRFIIVIVIFIICVLPVFISGTYSTPDSDVNDNDSSPVQTGTTAAVSDGNTVSGSLSPGSQSTALYPCDISESENNGLRQIIKTYELDAGETPDCIPRVSFENGGWLYAFTDLTKKVSPVNATKDDSVTVSVDTDTKDIDEIISKLAPTLEYSSPDGFSGLLSLDISSIATEAADETEADPGAEIVTETSNGSIADSPVIGSSYHTTVAYRGTLSRF